MIKKHIFVCLAAIIAVLSLLAGCASQSGAPVQVSATMPPQIETTPEPEAAPESEEEPEYAEESLLTIGVAAEGEDVFAVVIKNDTGADITALSVKDSFQQAFPESLISEGDVFEAGEERILFYDATAAIESARENGDDEPAFDMSVTLADGRTAVMHDFPFDDMENGDIRCEDGVAFVVYRSISEEREISTLDAELALLEPQPEEEPPAEEPAEAPQTDAAPEQQPAQQAPTQQAQEPAPAQQPAEEPAPAEQPAPVDEPAPELEPGPVDAPTAAEEAESGCIGDDALVWD